jgi:hypothetical protein
MADESQPTSESNAAGWRLLGTRDFGCLWAGQVISQIGDGLNKVALLWFVYELTGSALKMTAIGLLQTIPPLVFGPLIGVYLYQLPKKTVMIVVDLLRTLMVLLIPLFYTFDMLTLERLYVLVFLISIVSTIFGPALASAVPLIMAGPNNTPMLVVLWMNAFAVVSWERCTMSGTAEARAGPKMVDTIEIRNTRTYNRSSVSISNV